MCDRCAEKLLDMAREVYPVPDEMGAMTKVAVSKALKEAAEIIKAVKQEAFEDIKERKR